MGRARNDTAAVAGLRVSDLRHDRFTATLGERRGARRFGDLPPAADRIRELGFDAPGLDGEAELFAATINRQTEEQRGRPMILVGVPELTARDVAPFASILIKNRAACAALPTPPTTFDAEQMNTSLVNLIVNSGTPQPWDMTFNSSFMLKTQLWWHAETVGQAGGEDDPAFDISAEIDAIKALYERLCEHFQIPEHRRSRRLCS